MSQQKNTPKNVFLYCCHTSLIPFGYKRKEKNTFYNRIFPKWNQNIYWCDKDTIPFIKTKVNKNNPKDYKREKCHRSTKFVFLWHSHIQRFSRSFLFCFSFGEKGGEVGKEDGDKHQNTAKKLLQGQGGFQYDQVGENGEDRFHTH